MSTKHQSPIEAMGTAAPKSCSAVLQFDAMPNSAYLREAQLVQSPKRPGAPAPLPFSANTLWRKVRSGEFPKPIKLGPRITAWKAGDVRAWINAQAAA